MLLTLVLILLLIGAAVVGSIYSNFLVFYSNFNESENYHRAYYNSIAGLERAELVIKQRSPGYEGYGGWIIGEEGGTGYNNDGGSDGIINKFSYLSNNLPAKNTSTIFWDIKSQTTRIPAEGNGDIDGLLEYNDPNNPNNPANSSNFNMMDYNYSQVFLLYYDKSEGNPYKKTKGCIDPTNPNPTNPNDKPCKESKLESIKGTIRLPLYLTEKNFGDLDTDKSLIGVGPTNDAIVDRQIRGNFIEGGQTYPFTIYATQDTSKKVKTKIDNAIRESHINKNEYHNGLNFEFSKNNKKRSPTPDGEDAELTIISPKENNIKDNLGWENGVFNPHNNDLYFETIFNDDENNPTYTGKQLRFSLLNLLETKKTNELEISKIYPFLEYYVEFFKDESLNEKEVVSDKYFTINAEGNYGDYKINTIVWKPTSKESVLGSFTSVF